MGESDNAWATPVCDFSICYYFSKRYVGGYSGYKRYIETFSNVVWKNLSEVTRQRHQLMVCNRKHYILRFLVHG